MGRTPPTSSQLQRGAGAISYRAQQLSNTVILANEVDLSKVLPKPVLTVLNNGRIESALAHARSLCDFLGPKPNKKGRREYLHHSHFTEGWSHQVSNITGQIYGAVSEHLSHPVIGDSIADPHPGKWPLPELAVTLVGGLNDFVAAAMDATPIFDPSWFTPRPYETYVHLMQGLPLLHPTWPSEHKDVRRLTIVLHQFLQSTGQLPDDLSLSWQNQGYDPAAYGV